MKLVEGLVAPFCSLNVAAGEIRRRPVRRFDTASGRRPNRLKVNEFNDALPRPAPRQTP